MRKASMSAADEARASMVALGDEDGDITIFKLGTEPEVVAEINMGNSIYSTPIAVGDTLYIANKSHLFAIREGATPAP
jgi:hypothetical protein